MTSSRSQELPELVVRDAAAWRKWLGSYDQALEEALSHGWIDGQARGRDDDSYRLRLTPRRKRSAWSKRNRVIADRLISEGRMRAAGVAEIERAKSDGRWQAAYHGQATIEVPDDLTAALNAQPAAKAMFRILSAPNRYAVLYRIQDAKRPETRARRIERFVAMLARGETIYAQRKILSG